MKINILKWLLPFVVIISNSVYAEAISNKEGYLKQLSSQELNTQIHNYLIGKIKIDNPQPYTDKETHHHYAIWRCTKAIDHKHYGARNHSHTHNCPNRPVYRRGMPMRSVVPVARAKKLAKPQASSTNIQEQGVDEADLVKTDGRYLFAISNNNSDHKASGIRIFDTQSDSKQAKQIATIGFQKNIRLTGMYLIPEKNHLIVLGDSYGNALRKNTPYWLGNSHIITLDIRNKTKPYVIEHVKMEGYSKTTRRIGNKLYMVLMGNGLAFPSTYKYLETPKKMTELEYEKVKQEMITEIKKWTIEKALPYYRVLGKSAVKPLMNANGFLFNPGEINSYLMTTLVAIDLNAKSFEFKTSNYFGYSGTIYASNKALYISLDYYGQQLKNLNNLRFPPDLSKTIIHKFAFHKENGFDYRGSGGVLGNFNWRANSFQLDEDNKGNLRVVTSNRNNQRKYADPAANSPVILTALAEHPHNKQLITLSRLPNRNQPKALGKKGEQLYGVRLFNDYAYFVTFKRTDPLYVVDMRNPRGMRVVAALEIPGFSDYLHPINQNLLLGVGEKANEKGRVQGLKISLFDISNPKNPREIDKIHLGKAGTYSPANNNHHAFTSLKMRNSPITRVSLPVSLVTNTDRYTTENGLHQFEVNTSNKKITHVGQLLPPQQKQTSWYWNNEDRSIIIDNKLYYYHNGTFGAGSCGQKDKTQRSPHKTN